MQLAWIKLAMISKQSGNNTNQLATALQAWRAENPNHIGNTLFPNDASLANLQVSSEPMHFALLLPLQGPFAALWPKPSEMVF